MGSLMADYYMNISTVIDDPTVADREWWKNTIELVERFRGDEIDEKTYEALTQDEKQILEAVTDDGVISWGIRAEVDKNVWFADEDGGPNIDGLAKLIQIFHQKLRPMGIHTIRWAETCSKPRVDSFGGGVIAITAREIKALNVSQAEENAVRSFKETGFIDFEEG